MKKQLRKAFVYRLEPTLEQVEIFLEYSSAARFVFNWGLAQIKEFLDEQKKAKKEAQEATNSSCESPKSHQDASQDIVGESQVIDQNQDNQGHVNNKKKLPTYFDFTSGGLTALKKTENWLNRTPCHTLQASYKDLDLAMKAFFRRVKAKEPRAGFPRFKNKYQDHAFRFPDPVKMHKVTESHIYIPKIGPVKYIRGKYYDKRPISGAIKTMTVKKEGKHWYVSLSCLIDREVPEIEIATSQKLELGITKNDYATFLRCSDGNDVPAQNFYQNQMSKLANLQKALASKTKGSYPRQKVINRINQLHIDIKNRRKDFLHKLSTKLVQNSDELIVKDLPIKEMMKDEQFALALGDAGWHNFVLMLKNKCAWFGKNFKEV